MKTRESLCVGCPDCVGCGRSHDWVTVFYCDSCGEEIDLKKDGFKYNDKHFCGDCFLYIAAEELNADRLEDDE